MKHFLNDPHELVREAIDGTLASIPGLARLDGYPAIKVVVRAERDATKVAVISGGGAGHEPAHVGFVGAGMLTAAVSGEVFASPSVDAVLAAILAVTGDAGCLLVVKNYTGDRLNFGLAAERARVLGKQVAMVIVADDVALPGAAQPRGVAGTLFVHKVAGHAAERGAPLATVCALAERAAANVASIGLSLASCSIPGQPETSRLGANEAELGLGIHGEPGVEVIPVATAQRFVDVMVERLSPHLADAAARFALLVNGLGGVSNLELALLAKCALESRLREQVTYVVGPASVMTSLDMRGFSLSLLRLDPELEAALVAPVGPRHWPPAVRVAPAVVLPLPKGLARPTFPPSSDPGRRRLLETLCRALLAHEAPLNALDAQVGDGDTGTTLALAARDLIAQADAFPFADLASLFFAVSDRLSQVMGGSSGVLLAVFTARVASALQGGVALPAALEQGLLQLQTVGGAKPGDRTMVDALGPALATLEAKGSRQAVAEAARRGAAATAEMSRAGAGRSSYVRTEALRGVADPGAVAVAVVFDALAAN